MDELVKNKFNNGNNDGKILIVSNEQEKPKIKCHKFILINTCDYFDSMKDFNKKKQNTNIQKNEPIEIKFVETDDNYGFSYDSLICALNYCYYSQYVPNNYDFNLIIDTIEILDMWQFKLKDKINKKLVELYILKITKENWMDAISLVPEDDMYEKLITSIVSYIFCDKIRYKEYINSVNVKEYNEKCDILSKKLMDKPKYLQFLFRVLLGVYS